MPLKCIVSKINCANLPSVLWIFPPQGVKYPPQNSDVIYLLVQFLLTPKSVACLYSQTQRGSDLVISFRSMLPRCIGMPIIKAVSLSARKSFKPKSCTEELAARELGKRSQGDHRFSSCQSLLSWCWANSRHNVTIKRERIKKKLPLWGGRGKTLLNH